MTAEQLKNSILQMAVSGKLVPQDPNDEPAGVLLDRIRKEKEQLIKEGRIKKDKNPSYIFRGVDNILYEKDGDNMPVSIADEIPFEIPESWEWVRLGTIMSVISDGTHKTPHYVESGIPFLSVQNISKGHFDFSKIKYITAEEHSKLIERVEPQKDDILFCRIGTLGKAIKISIDLQFSIFVSLGLLRPISKELSDFIVLAINSPLGDRWIQDNKVGGGTHTFKINLSDIPFMLVPIPPIAEQQRIIDKMKEIEPYLNDYETSEQALSELNNSFPEKLKKSILQMAMQGKLTQQDSNDEAASALLERIRKEKEQLIKEGKIKRDKNESVIYRSDNSYYERMKMTDCCIDDEIPFDIPETWIWARLISVCEEIGDIDHNMPKSSNNDDGIPFLSAKDILNDNTLNFSKDVKHISYEDYLRLGRKMTPRKNDIVFSRIGSLGKVGVVDTEDKFLISYSCCIIRPLLIDLEYLKYYLMCPIIQSHIRAAKTGIGVPDLGMNEIKRCYIPVPPLNEQKRIVAKVEELLPLLQ